MDLSYAAGLFDGEGSVSITIRRRKSAKPWHEVYAQMSMVRREALDFLSLHWGGKVYAWRGPTGRAYFKWCVYTARSISFLRDIRPYLRIKEHAVDLALSFGDTKDFEGREVLHQALMAENRRRPLSEGA